MKTIIALIALLALTGCVTTGTNGVDKTGTNQYIVGGIGKFTDYSGSAVKVRFIKEAEDFCKQKGEDFEVLSSTSKDVVDGNYASAEV